MYNHLAHFVNKKFGIDAHYFIKGGFWLTVTQVITVALGVITTALFAHFLSENEYGTYRYLIGLAALFSAFSLTGIGQSILQTAAKKYHSFYSETLGLNYLFNTGVIFMSISGSIYYWTHGNLTLSLGCLITALLQPISNVFQYTPSYLQGDGKFRESTIMQGARTVLTSVGSVVVLLITKNILVLFFTYLLITALVNVFTHFLYRPKSAAATPPDILKKYITYAKNSSLRNVISSLASRADAIIIFTQLGAAQLALYTIVLIIPEQIKGSVKNFASLLLPKYAKHENHSHILAGIPRRSLQLFIVLSIATVTYILIVPFVYQLLFPKYPSAIFLSQLLALSFPAMISILPVSFLQSQLKEKDLYKSQTLEAIVTVTSSLVLTIHFGVIGAVLAKVATRYLTSIYYFILIYKKSKTLS